VSPMKIWVVFGWTGEYSDRSGWLVDAWDDESKAQERVTFLSEKYRELVGRHTRWSDAHDNGIEAMREIDPGFSCDYTGTHYYYKEADLTLTKKEGAA